jgi:hypothetical protein
MQIGSIAYRKIVIDFFEGKWFTTTSQRRYAMRIYIVRKENGSLSASIHEPNVTERHLQDRLAEVEHGGDQILWKFRIEDALLNSQIQDYVDLTKSCNANWVDLLRKVIEEAFEPSELNPLLLSDLTEGDECEFEIPFQVLFAIYQRAKQEAGLYEAALRKLAGKGAKA